MDYSNCVKSEEYSSNSASILRPTTPISTMATERAWYMQPNIVPSYNDYNSQAHSIMQNFYSHYNMPINFDHGISRTHNSPAIEMTNKSNSNSNQSHRKDGPKSAEDYRTTFTKTHSAYLYKQIRELYIHTRVLDVYFLVGRQYIGAHFCILAYTSPMLKNLLLEVTGDSMFISVPDVSILALENLIHFVYNGSLKNNSVKLEEISEAAQYLQMDEVNSILLKYRSFFESQENPATVLSSKEKMVDRGNKLERSQQQNLSPKISQPEAHCSSTTPSSKILSELLSKSDYNRQNHRLTAKSGFDVSSLTTPLNLSKDKNSSTYKPTADQKSLYLGYFGTLPDLPHYLRDHQSAFNLSSQTNSHLLPSYPSISPFGSTGTIGSGSNSRLKDKLSYTKNKLHKKDSSRPPVTPRQSINAPHCAPSSQQTIPLQNILTEMYTKQMQLINNNLPNYSIYNNMPHLQNVGLSPLNLKGMFPHLFSASSLSRDQNISSEQVSPSLPPDINLPPDISVVPASPIKQNQTVLNLSSSMENVGQPNKIHETKVSNPSFGIYKHSEPKVEPDDFKLNNSLTKTISSHSSPVITVSEKTKSPEEKDLRPSPNKDENNHIDSYTQTAASSLASSTTVINTPIQIPDLKNFPDSPMASYDILKRLNLDHLGIPFRLPSNISHSSNQETVLKTDKTEKINSSPIDLSQVGLPGTFGSTILAEGNISENVEIDVVGSPYSQHGENSRMTVSQNSGNVPPQNPRKEIRYPFNDSKPATPESVELIEESVAPETVPVVQRRSLHGVNMGRKRKGCGDCVGCQVATDCGQCRFCKDKSKYGGPNRLKQVCINKRCSDLHNESNDARKRRRLLNRKKQMKCGSCNGCQRSSDCGECYSCLQNNNDIQPPPRKKGCEMRLCEVEEAKAFLNVTEEPSPYSTDSLLAPGLRVASTSDLESDALKLKRPSKKRQNQAESSSKVRTKYYCGKCPGCTTTNPCGYCIYCGDMPKFGGPGRYRQKCIKQLCKLHPRLQALKNSNRNKPTEDQTKEENRQNIFDNSGNENSNPQLVEDNASNGEEKNDISATEVYKQDSYKLLHLIQSVNHKSSQSAVKSDCNDQEINSEEDFKPINKLHIKKCDEESSSRWQIQSISVGNDNYEDKTHVAIDLSNSGQEISKQQTFPKVEKYINVISDTCAVNNQKNLPTNNTVFAETSEVSTVLPEVSPISLNVSNISPDVSTVSPNVHDISYSEISIDKLDSQYLQLNPPLEKYPSILTNQMDEQGDSLSSVASSPSPPSSKPRGRPRGRGKSKNIVSGRGGRKRRRKRRGLRFTVDREDHSDYEDNYVFDSRLNFENMQPQIFMQSSLKETNFEIQKNRKDSLEHKRSTKEVHNSPTTDFHGNFNSTEDPAISSNSELRPSSASNIYGQSDLYSSPLFSDSSESEKNFIASSIKKIEPSLQDIPSTPLTNSILSLVNPINSVVPSTLPENSYSLDLSRNNDSHIPDYKLQCLGVHSVSDKNSYNIHLNSPSSKHTLDNNVSAKLRDENENLDVTYA